MIFKCPHCKTELTKNQLLFSEPCLSLGTEKMVPNVYSVALRSKNAYGHYVIFQPTFVPDIYYCKKCGYIEQHFTEDDLETLEDFSPESSAQVYIPQDGYWDDVKTTLKITKSE